MSERGAVTAMVAVLSVALLAIAGLAVDGGRALARDQQAAAVADEAARAGSQALSVTGLRSGVVIVDPAAATLAADRVLAGAGLAGSVSVSGRTVRVQVTDRFPTTMLGIVGITAMTVHATAVATDVHGVTEGNR